MRDETHRLVQEASTGVSVAVDELLVRFLPQVRDFVRLRSGAQILGRETPEDIVQSVCREVLEDMDAFEYRGEKSFKRWLYLTAERKVLERARFYARERRDAKREEPITSDLPGHLGRAGASSPSRIAILGEEMDRLEQVFDALPRDYAEVITLAKIVGLSHREIGEEIGRSPEAARVLLHRALARLGTLLTRG